MINLHTPNGFSVEVPENKDEDTSPRFDVNLEAEAAVMYYKDNGYQQTINYLKKLYSDDKISISDKSRIISELNPIGFAEKLKSNVIIIQSTSDEVLEPKLAKRFYSLLNGEKSYLEVPNTTHDLMGDEKELIGAVWETSAVE